MRNPLKNAAARNPLKNAGDTQPSDGDTQSVHGDTQGSEGRAAASLAELVRYRTVSFRAEESSRAGAGVVQPSSSPSSRH